MRLVQVRYRIAEYMEDGGRIKEELFTVDADSDGEAEQKVYDYFNNISDPYGTSYFVYDCDAVKHLS
ncbi:hypothetical protein M8756_18945 [Lutimaribacter sp. EGI FJ00015]|nr:hypothetical protein [Lutimaribacter sp. EGI FJ00015]